MSDWLNKSGPQFRTGFPYTPSIGSITVCDFAKSTVDAFNIFNHTQFSGVNRILNFWIFSTITNGRINNCNAIPLPTSLAVNPNTGIINTGGFGAINGVRPARVLQTVVRFVF